ncbi:MAG: hypothetical protein M1812_007360 [Candelaria pacifica]|nr:MAG: hypothetical protein M1812_007360 [Candelaria pacifica]
MAPSTPSAKTTLSYPLYGVDFDPHNDRYLITGGGGGEVRSGVGNKITLLDASSRNEIFEVTTIELSRDEDSVTSLAASSNTGSRMVAFAGINSSTADQEAGKNEHLRFFRVTYPLQKDPEEDIAKSAANTLEKQGNGDIALVGKASLFRPSTGVKKETYQRVLRLSPARRDCESRLGAVATGLAPEGEVVLFNATTGSPKNPDFCGRIALNKGEEAADLDFVKTGREEFHLAYCTDYEVFLYSINYDFESEKARTSSPKPRLLYSTPFPDVFSSTKKRPTFRSLRFLTPNHLLLLCNSPQRSGVELQVLQIAENGLGDMILTKRPHKSIKASTGFDVSILDADSSGAKQIVIAVAGADLSIELLTLDYTPIKGFNKFRPYTVLQNVHPLQITKIAFSTFHPPSHPVTSSTLPQYIKLASVSMSNTIVVHTLAVSPTPTGYQSKTPRYVLVQPGSSEMLQTSLSIFVSLFMVIFGAIMLQALLEIRGGTPPYLGAVNYLHPNIKNFIARPYVLSSNDPTISVKQAAKSSNQGLRYLLGQRIASSSKNKKAVFIKDHIINGIQAETHDNEEVVKRQGAKKWEDLESHERENWKRRLIEAGEWTVAEGESVLRGVFFGGVAGVVGQVVAGL